MVQTGEVTTALHKKWYLRHDFFTNSIFSFSKYPLIYAASQYQFLEVDPILRTG